MTADRTIRLQLTKNALYAANTGRGFDRLGLLSVSRAHLSTKSRFPPVEISECEDAELVDVMRELRLSVYQKDRNQIRADYNQEHETGQSYEGRCIWELLQNADDAMSPPDATSAEMIGAKGLGFKSVLEFTDRPAVFSGPFAFEFNAEKSRPMLAGLDPGAPPLTFQLPHVAEFDPLVRRLRREGFSSVVRLPFRDADARVEAQARLRALTAHFLLLSQHLQTVDIRFADGSKRTLARSGPAGDRLEGDLVKLTVQEDGQIEKRDWRVWARRWSSERVGEKRLSAALAVPADGHINELDQGIPLHVFYPTRENINAPFLVHAAFSLTPNRNQLTNSAHDLVLAQEVARMASAAARSLPALQALQLFASLVRTAPVTGQRPRARLHKTIAEAIRKTAFVPIIGSKDLHPPGQVRPWQHGLGDFAFRAKGGIVPMRLAHPSLREGFALLQQPFRASPLQSAEYAQALGQVRCAGLADCIAAARLAQAACLSAGAPVQSTLDLLGAAPIWSTSEGKIRPLKVDPALVSASAADWPDWLHCDVLDPAMVSLVSDPALTAVQRAGWTKLLKGALLRTPDEWLAHAVAPELAGWTSENWTAKGWDALALVRRWLPSLEFRSIAPFVPGKAGQEEGTREKLARVMRAPSKKSWVPTIDAYAAPAIEGPKTLADFIRERPDRYLIGAPKESTSVGSWKALLRYLGVSWEPKLRKFPAGWQPPVHVGRFLVDTNQGLKYPDTDWYLEFFPECLAQTGTVAILKMLESLVPVTSDLPARWAKVYGSGTTHTPRFHGSFANWQLRCETYLKCRPGLSSAADRLPAHRIYWPDNGLPGITPTLDLHSFDLRRRKELKRLFVEALGVKDSLPATPGEWAAWANAIAKSIDADPTRPRLRDIRGFYDAALGQKLPAGSLSEVPIVCETSEGLKTSHRSRAVWIDQPDLAFSDVQDSIRIAGLAIFPVQLHRGERIEALFGIRPASAVMTLKTDYVRENSRQTDFLEQRLRGRAKALAVTFDTKGKPWRAPRILAVHGLRLEIILDDQVLSSRAVASHKAGDIWRVSLDGDPFDALARACVGDLPPHLATDLRRRILAILEAKASQISAVLIDDGVPEYRLHDILPDGDETDPDQLPALDTAETSEKPEPEEEALHPVEPQAPIKPLTLDDIRKTPTPVKPPKLAARDLYGEGPQGRARSGTPRPSAGRAEAGRAAEQALQRGLDAEAWFAHAVEKSLPDTWTVRFNERDQGIRESDVVICNSAGDWHIEVKNLTTERLYWSELERAKAEALPGRYFMALLIGTPQQGYHLFWLWDPLRQMGDFERRLQWVWADTQLGPPLVPGLWTPASGTREPSLSPTRVNHVVRIPQASLPGFTKGGSDLQVLWDRCVADTIDPATTEPEAGPDIPLPRAIIADLGPRP